MPVDPRKHQKKQERRAALRKSKQQQLGREKNVSLAERLKVAAKSPILHCWVLSNLWSQGMGSVYLSRLLPHGSVAFATFLVDAYCLGVKDAMATITDRSTYESHYLREIRAKFAWHDIEPAEARKIVEGAVEYARGLGFHPHADYQEAKLLFGDIDASACTKTFEFGKDGNPLFFAGPHDTPARCRQILRTLEESCGVGGFHYIMPMSPDGDDPFPE